MNPITLLDYASQVTNLYLGKGKSKKTARQFRQVLRELRETGLSTTDEITDEAIVRWIESLPTRTPETFRSHLRALSSLCRRAKRKGYLAVNPFDVDPADDWIRLDGRPKAPRRRWSKPADEIRAMLARSTQEAAGGDWDACRLRAYAHTLFLTGGRPGEIQRLRLEDFHRRERALEIVAHWITKRGDRQIWWKPKTVGSAGVLPIGETLFGILDDWSRHVRIGSRRGRLRIHDCGFLFPGKLHFGPWTDDSRGDRPLAAIRALGERAGVSELTQKAARKGIGTYRDIGLTPQGRREYFRHSDDATGDLYDERDVESRRGDAVLIERFFTGT